MNDPLDPCPRPQPPQRRLSGPGWRGLSLAGGVALALSACGGGGGGGWVPSPAPSPAPAPAPAPTSISGVAASGSAFSGASVTVVDKLGATVCSTTTDAQGNYHCDLPTTATAPLVVSAQRGTESLYSISASPAGGRVNVTPITTVVVSRLSPNGDPAQLAAGIGAGTTQVDEATVRERVAEVLAILKPLLDVLGDSVDPITGAFTADGTGHDRVLDSIDVTVRPDGTAANIEITLQSIPSAGAQQPIAVNFRSTDPTVAPLPSITLDQLARPGVGDAIAALLARMTACYAVPLTQRVGTATSDTGNAVGSAADVVAPACREMFAGGDPAQWLSNGNRVGRDAANNGAFTGIFRGGATGVTFDQGELGFYRPNGDVVVRYRTLSPQGAEGYDTVVARYEGDALKLIGNQYAYNANVTPSMARRAYLNASGIDWIGVGYNLFVSNRVSGGAPVFAKVEVTSPAGKVYTLLPAAGNSYLGVADANGALSAVTSTVLLNGKSIGASGGRDPRTLEPTLFVDPTVWTDDQIRQLNNQGVWRMEFFHADTAVPNVVQSYRTSSRPLTADEASHKSPFSDITPGMRARLVAATSANASGVYVFGAPSAGSPNVFAFSDGGQPAWAVPSTATGPTLFSVFGRGPLVNNVRASFNDDVSIASTARTATATCTIQSAGDTHCDTTTGTTQYALNAYVSTLQLYVRSQEQMEVFSLFALYKPAQ
ncbi:MAG: carboxypeptidase regulatory-like domain-containing protein [Variovorax sp.]|nr:carboxypeptidase regulatory-like domain-containing protein [Variovorax sp.]